MPRFTGPAPAHVDEWRSILQTLEAAGRFPAQTPEVRRQKAIDFARWESRLQDYRMLARSLRDLAPLSDEETLTPRCPGVPNCVSSLDR